AWPFPCAYQPCSRPAGSRTVGTGPARLFRLMEPQPPDGANPVRRDVVAHAEGCAGSLAAAGQRPQPEAAVRTGGGWTVLALAHPPPDGAGHVGLTDCDVDCLSLLAQTRAPLSAERVCRGLEKHRIGVYGIATVKRALARLKRMGLVWAVPSANRRTDTRAR